MSVIDNVLVALRRGRLAVARAARARPRPRAGGAGREPARLRRLRRAARSPGRRAAARRQAPGRDRPRAGRRAQRAGARRAGGGARSRRHAPARRAACARSRATGIMVLLVEHDMKLVMSRLRPRRRARCRPEDRRGPAGARSRATRSCSRPISASSCTPRATARRRWRPRAARCSPRERLSAGYGALDVIRDIDLEVEKGELVAVLGANGAGKSTLMRALSGLNRPVGGGVLFLGRRIERFSPSRIVGEGLVLVPEGRQVFPELSVIDNIRLGAYARPGRRRRGHGRAPARPVPAAQRGAEASGPACSRAASSRCSPSPAG